MESIVSENFEIIFGYKIFIEKIEDLNQVLIINKCNTINIYASKSGKVKLIILGEILGSSPTESIPALLTEEEKLKFNNPKLIVLNFIQGIKQTNLPELLKIVRAVKKRNTRKSEFLIIKEQIKEAAKRIMRNNEPQNIRCHKYLQPLVLDLMKTQPIKLNKRSNSIELSM